MVTIKLKEREIPLLFSAEELRVMQLEIGPTNKAISLVLGRNPDNKDDDSKFGSPDTQLQPPLPQPWSQPHLQSSSLPWW